MRKIDWKNAFLRLEAWLWKEDTLSSYWYQRWSINILRVFSLLIRNVDLNQLTLRATSLVYTTLISIVPLLAFSFSILKGLGFHNQLEPVLLKTLEPLGEQRFDIVSNLITFVDNIKVGVLGTMGLVVLIYTVIAMMQKIEDAFNYTWMIRSRASLISRVGRYISAVFFGPLLIFLSLAIKSELLSHTNISVISQLPILSHFVTFLMFLIPWIFMALGFSTVYTFIPNTKVNFLSAFVGSIFTVIAWKIMGLIFSVFIAGSSQQTLIYSAFASIIIFMLWIYFGWLILMIGASIAFYHQNLKKLWVTKNKQPLSVLSEDALLLNISFLVAKHFFYGKERWTIKTLEEYLNYPHKAVLSAVYKLKAIDFLVLTQDDPAQIQPAKPLNQLFVHEVIQKSHMLGKMEGNWFEVETNYGSFKVQEFLEYQDKIIQSGLNTLTYKQWIISS